VKVEDYEQRKLKNLHSFVRNGCELEMNPFAVQGKFPRRPKTRNKSGTKDL